MVDIRNVEAIAKLNHPRNVHKLSPFLGKIRWKSQFIHFLANLVIPVYKIMWQDRPYFWTEQHM